MNDGQSDPYVELYLATKILQIQRIYNNEEPNIRWPLDWGPFEKFDDIAPLNVTNLCVMFESD